MARTTHDRIRDHEGIDLDTNIELDGATTSYADGDVLHDVISDLDDRVSAGGGGGGGLADMVIGDDQTFDASLGNWTNSGGTMTRDTSYKMDNATASLKFVSSTAGNYIDLPITGTFKADTDYVAVFFISCENTSSTFSADVSLGFDAGDQQVQTMALNMSTSKPYVGNGTFLAASILWRPTIDYVDTGHFRFKINFSSSVTWHIGMLRVWETPTVGFVEAHGIKFTPLTTVTSHSININPWGDVFDGVSIFDSGNLQLQVFSGKTGMSFENNFEYTNIWTENTPGDKDQVGFNMTVGDDYLGFFIGQKNSDTIQFYADFGDYNFEFEDGSAGLWKTTDGTNTTPFANLHYLKHGTADPSAGGGVASAIGSFYGRDNSGAGELWLKTGSAATAWTKLNVP